MTASRRKLPEPLELQRANGEGVELGAFLDRRVLIVAIRYYG